MKMRDLMTIAVVFALIALVPGAGLTDEYDVNDAAGLNSAMTSAENTVGIGDTINMAAGIYSITSTLLLLDPDESSFALIGQGPGQTILDGNGNTQILRINTTGGAGATSRILLQDLTFRNGSSSTQGGAVWVMTNAAELVVDNVWFEENESVNHGGGLYFNSTSGNLEVMSSHFFSNRNTGGAQADGGGLYGKTTSTGDITVQESSFEKNFANLSSGGGAYVVATNGTITVERDMFTDNDATSGSGGGLYVQTLGASGVAEVENCLFTGNQANLGGGLNASALFGPLSVVNVTAVSNSAVGAGAMYASLNTNSATLDIYNSIFYGNSKNGLAGTDIYVASNNNGPVTVQYNSYEDLVVVGSPPLTETSNIDVDPLLDSGYMLSAGSSCIDAGNSLLAGGSFDLAGNDRVVDDPDTVDTGNGTPAVDMGAYEFQPASSGGGGGGGGCNTSPLSNEPVWPEILWIVLPGGVFLLWRRRESQ